jgi:hypothetical protein
LKGIVIREFTTFFFGVTALTIVVRLGSLGSHFTLTSAILMEAGLFLLSSWLGCLLFPKHPFRAGAFVVLGAFIGIVFDLKMNPTLNGFERNLFPLEILYHTILAAISCTLCAVLWKIFRTQREERK